MKFQSKLNRIFLISILISLLFCFFSFTGCNTRAEQKSLTDQFITIDSLIQQNQVVTAVKELKKAEKRAYDGWSYLGIYKRYMKLGDMESAEKILKKAIKSFPDNNELIAVYTNFFIVNNRLDEALVLGKKLVGTEYSSLYSEVMLRQSSSLITEDSHLEFYSNNDFYNVFYDAYLVGKNPMWIRDCAIFDLINGRYERIPQLVPAAFANVDDAYFWALALYDAGKYYDSIEAVKQSQSFLKDMNGVNTERFKTSEVQQIALLSDAYMCVSDMERAEQARQGLIFNIDNLNKVNLNDPLLPVIMTNSAIFAYNQGLEDQCADLLFYVVSNWPDFISGLVLYTDFAYKSNIQRKEDMEMLALRDAGLASLEMERYDNRRKIPISDAKYRVDLALEHTNDPYLRIVQLDLKYKLDKSLNDKDKTRDLWQMLENSATDEEKYKGLLVQYVLNSLLLTKQYDDAFNLFQSYIYSISNFNADRSFWEQFVENIRSYDLKIAEFGAWFAAYYKERDEALRLHEYCVYESSGVLDEGIIAQNVSTATCMNLGDIYFSIGRNEKALDLYGRAGGRESKKSLRSDIFYRIACIYTSLGDTKNALRSAEYACSLYPENARASLLKDKLKAEL